ncbi:cation channel sperm-associated auxiliary subunit gamma-like isoform X2 [Styela clava]
MRTVVYLNEPVFSAITQRICSMQAQVNKTAVVSKENLGTIKIGMIVLCIWVWLRCVSALNFHWTLEVTTLEEEFQIDSHPDAASRAVDIASIPQDFSNQDSGSENQTMIPHLAKVQISDENGKISDMAMMRLLSSTAIPTAKIFYPSTTENNFDSGNSLLKIQGMIYKIDEEPTLKLCILYPIPMAENLRTIHFSLPYLVVGDIMLQEIRIPFHGDFVNKYDKNIISAVYPPHKHKWVPEMSSNGYSMVFSHVENILLSSFDEFEHLHSEEVMNSQETQCSDYDDFAIPFQKRILYMSKAGPFLLVAEKSDNWKVIRDSIIYDDAKENIVCLKRATVSPPSYSEDIIVVSSQKQLFITSADANRPDAVLYMKQLNDSNGVNVCQSASLSESDCSIIGHSFDASSYLELFVLLQSISTSKLTLVKYKGSVTNGQWSKLFTIMNKLPTTIQDKENLVFLSQTEEYSGQSTEIAGISTLTRPDGTLYIWGNVLLVYDIRSGILGWVHSFDAQSSGQSDHAIQFSSPNEKNIYSILTSNGKIWVGSAYPFEKHFSHLLTQVSTGEKAHLAVYFDSSDVLYGLTYHVTNGNEYAFKREEIKIKESNLECDKIYNCPRLSLQCEADSSVFHINHTRYSRIRHFSIYPPQLMPKAQKNPYFPHLYDKTSLATFFAVKQRFFSGQKINQTQWWLNENDYIREKENYKLNRWWYTHDEPLKQYLKFLAIADFLPNDPMMYIHEGQYLHEIAQPLGKYETWNAETCGLPSVIYLDKNQEYRFNITIEHALSDSYIAFNDLRLVIVTSNNNAIDITPVRLQTPFSILYMIVITGKQTSHKPPGKHLTSVSASFYPWNPASPSSKYSCCTTVPEGTSYEQNLLVKVGCPPARRLMFDSQRSLEILFNRGRTDNFECLYDVEDDVPCFTTSEFAAAFYVEDLVTGERSIFDGNYTLQIVGGGIGYLQNVREYNEEEILSYNYRPGDSKSLLSLIWSVLLEGSSEGMKDEKTGRLIFDAKDPASIVFECRLDSPCGNIPLGTYNPGEFYIQIEVSNKGVDSSTNCDYTMRFMIHLIGIELSPRVHLMLMLVMLSVLFILAILYYVWNFGGGHQFFRKLLGKEDFYESDSEEDFAEPPPQFREILNRRLTIGGIQTAGLPGGTGHKSSLLAQSLHLEEHGVKRSSLRVHGVLNTKSNTSRTSTQTLKLN